jgi:hypothetical protein
MPVKQKKYKFVLPSLPTHATLRAMKKLPSELLVRWFGEKGDEYLGANEKPEDVLKEADATSATCWRYVLKEEVTITQTTQIKVKAKHK